MFLRLKLSLLLVVLGTVISYSDVGLAKDPKEMETSNDLIGFQVVGDPKAVDAFRTQFDKRSTQNGLLEKYCTDPITPGHKSDKDSRLIFVCEAVAVVFTETGEVFLAATPPHSPRPDLEMTASTGTACTGKRCAKDLSTDCVAYFGICYHRGWAGVTAHICQ